MITFNILAHDGTLYPTWARYKGCTYFCDQCCCISVDNVIDKVENRILYRLDNLAQNNLGSEIRVYTQCPSDRFPEKDKSGNEIKKPKIELFAFRLAFADGQPNEEQNNTAVLFKVKENLDKQNLCINTIRSNVSCINLDDGSMTMECPKLPKDTDAKIGVRRNPQNPSKKQKIFGYDLVLTTSVELHLKIELPVTAQLATILQVSSCSTCFDISMDIRIWLNSFNCFVTMIGDGLIVSMPVLLETTSPAKALSQSSELALVKNATTKSSTSLSISFTNLK